MSRSEVCRVLGIHRNTLRRWQQRAAQGSLESRHGGGNPRKIVPKQEGALVRQLQAAPDATVDEHVARWQEETGHKVSRSAMGRAVLRLGWTRKKERESAGRESAGTESTGAAPVDHPSSAVGREAVGVYRRVRHQHHHAPPL